MPNITPISSVSDLYGTTPVTAETTPVTGDSGFASMLGSVMALLKDTNSLQEIAQKEEVAFALGETDNTHDLMVAEQKANIALQYTVAIRDRVLEAYNIIMQMQI
ncbi:MAG: flagellar hook-basal body complex protein FliE [Pseudobutyrivibrio sp.]|nr:flagellar hook-basal body complex protein FliE [Pseudobutyrivibrio sp.]